MAIVSLLAPRGKALPPWRYSPARSKLWAGPRRRLEPRCRAPMSRARSLRRK